MGRNYIFLIFLLWDVIGGFAQETPKQTEPWTLQQCIAYAIKNNIQLKQSQISVELAKESLNQSYGSVLPTLNGSAGHTYNVGRAIDPFTNTFADKQVLSQNFSLSTSIVLFNGFQNYNLIKQNELNYMAGKYDADKARNDISLSVATGYLQILFSQELVEASRNQVELTRKQVERVKILVDAGSVAKGTLYDIQAQLSAEELTLVNAQNQLDIAYLTLAQLLELATAENFKIVKPELTLPAETVVSGTAGQIYNAAVTTLPEVKSAELKLRSAEKGLSIAWGGVSPSLTFGASIGTGYSGQSATPIGLPTIGGVRPTGITSKGDTVYEPYFNQLFETTPFFTQYKDNVNKTFGFRLNIPLFNGFQNSTAIKRAKLQLQNAEFSLELTKKQINKTIQQAYADASASLKKYYATQKALDATEESFRYTDQKFNVGAVNALDYNTAKNKLIKSKSDLLQAKFDFIFKSKILDFYQGKPLSL